ncbi:hypothetical protein KSF_017680 [Reticulibacter mediterranei]|uniref:Uncharacterized protein n=1 Tax=Reticulibacter mediterranei TaxID=2778369 RepID=A0A8J3N0Y5_9CHLR|nr:hypothetical protein [Reticulibacter mediterranei]GHO91720.1 hypothetical protein KSF_017680 [Reticulibacter mediterranei]
MKQEEASRYLQKLGWRLQKQKITGEILVLNGITMFLDIKKPQMHKDIDAYLAGDEAALVLPKDIASYFGGDGADTGLSPLIVRIRQHRAKAGAY